MKLFYPIRLIVMIFMALCTVTAFAIPSAGEITTMYKNAETIPAKQKERNEMFYKISGHLFVMQESNVLLVFNDIAEAKIGPKINDNEETISGKLITLYQHLSSTLSANDNEVRNVFGLMLQIIKTPTSAQKPSLLAALVNGRINLSTNHSIYLTKIRPIIQSREDFISNISHYKKYLSFADLHDIDLHEKDLSEADLRGANLEQTNLWGTNLYKADARGAKYGKANERRLDQLNTKFAMGSCSVNVHGENQSSNSMGILWSKLYSLNGNESNPLNNQGCIPRAPVFWDDNSGSINPALKRNITLRHALLAIKLNSTAYKYNLPPNIKKVLRKADAYSNNEFDLFLVVQNNIGNVGEEEEIESGVALHTTHLRIHPWADYNVPAFFGKRLNHKFNMGIFGGDVIPFSIGNRKLTKSKVHTHDNMASNRGDSQILLNPNEEHYIWTIAIDPEYNPEIDPYSSGRKKIAVTLTIFVGNENTKNRVLLINNMNQLIQENLFAQQINIELKNLLKI